MKQRMLTLAFLGCFLARSLFADPALISLFPMENYDQTIASWINPAALDYDQPLLDVATQQARMSEFYDHNFGSSSPWNGDYVVQVLQQPSPNDLQSTEQTLIATFSNENKTGADINYGENFRPYAQDWIDDISANVNVPRLAGITYDPICRAIAIDNLNARSLPTDEVSFYNYQLPGEGYPFDNLQMSAVWAGTPLYIIAETSDHAWSLVLTPDFIAWVKTNGLARTSQDFINSWSSTAKNNLAAITQTKTSILDEQGGFLFSAYVGSFFPAIATTSGIKIMVPAADLKHQAVIKKSTLLSAKAAIMPLATTPHQFAAIMSTLLGRPYGWGGMYFYNDCSAELKSFFVPFGIMLPRHSSDQVTAGAMVDMSSSSPADRLAYLMEHGQRFLTLVYIGGHVVLYIGNYPNPNDKNVPMAMTYQDIWGLRPNPPTGRCVLGASVLFPMLLKYPEDPTLTSLAAKTYFQIAFLNQMPTSALPMEQTSLASTKAAASGKRKKIDIKSLMYSERMFEKPKIHPHF